MGYKKLVRDKIPEIITENGERPVVEKLNATAFRKALREKLIEEAAELKNAKTKEDAVSELADIQEVLLAIYNAEKIECSEINKVRNKKKKQRGAFGKRFFLTDVK